MASKTYTSKWPLRIVMNAMATKPVLELLRSEFYVQKILVLGRHSDRAYTRVYTATSLPCLADITAFGRISLRHATKLNRITKHDLKMKT